MQEIKNEHATYCLDTSLGFHIGRTSLAIKSVLRRNLADAGLDITPEQWGVLARLYEAEGRLQKDISECTVKDGASITRILDALEQKGYIERRPDPDDRRARRVYLTDAGTALKEPALIVVRRVRDQCFHVLEPAEQQQLMDMLRTIFDHLTTCDAGGANGSPPSLHKNTEHTSKD